MRAIPVPQFPRTPLVGLLPCWLGYPLAVRRKRRPLRSSRSSLRGYVQKREII